MHNTSAQLKKLRLSLKLTQDEFADKINAKRNSISMIESGRNKPTFEMISEICKAFNISADYFLAEDISNGIAAFSLDKNVNENVNSIPNKARNMHDYLLGMLEARNANRPDPLEIYYASNPVGIQTRRLQKLKEKYQRRIDRELKENETLYHLLREVDNLGDLIDVVSEMYLEHVNSRPDPFETTQYFDFDKNEFNIPNTIEYEDYKKEIVAWLENIEHLTKAIRTYHQQSQGFLEAISNGNSN